MKDKKGKKEEEEGGIQLCRKSVGGRRERHKVRICARCDFPIL